MVWSKERRTVYYAGVKAKRGEAAAQALIAQVKRQWNTSQQSLL